MVEFKRPSGANMTQDLTHYRREIIAYVVIFHIEPVQDSGIKSGIEFI